MILNPFRAGTRAWFEEFPGVSRVSGDEEIVVHTHWWVRLLWWRKRDLQEILAKAVPPRVAWRLK